MRSPFSGLGRLVLLLGVVAMPACKGGSEASSDNPVLTLGAYTTPREVYGTSLIPAFQKQWQEKTGKTLEVQESYLASGAQARAIVGGFEADVAALSLEPDIDTIRKADLITLDWKDNPYKGIVTRSVVVIGVRKGNPKNIEDWADLARDDVEVLTPNVRTSGGAMWNVLAIYGAAMRGHAGVPADDPAAATDLLAKILGNAEIMDRSGRDSMLTFERGVGDAIITYENEMLVGKTKGQDYEYVVPKSTISIDNPIAVVDVNATKHGNLELAKAFVEFSWTQPAQEAYAEFGLRPVLDDVAKAHEADFPKVTDLFTVDDIGGWSGVAETVFDDGAAYDAAMGKAAKEAG